jgi:hypothetical protein
MSKTKSELEDMTKDELVNYADDMDIEVHHHWNKDEIIKEIMKGEKAAAKEEAKAAAAPPVPAGVEVTDAPADESVKVEPELAKLQERANTPPDPATQFAATPPPKEK